MNPFTVILLAFAFVCFVLASFNTVARWNLVAAGLAFWVAVELFAGVSHLLH